MSIPDTRRIYKIVVPSVTIDGNRTSNGGSVTFYTRFVGEVGRDIAVVKYALGDVYQRDVRNDSPQDNEIIGKQWFSCDGDNKPLTAVSLATFDKRLQKSLMSFQLKHQLLMLNYYWSRRGLAAGIEQEADLPVAIQQMIYLFDAEYGSIGEATIALLHGWRPGADSTNRGFRSDTRLVPEQIPEYLYDLYVQGQISNYSNSEEVVHHIYDEEESRDNKDDVVSRFREQASEARKWHSRIMASARSEITRLDADINSDFRTLQDSERYIDYVATSTTEASKDSELYIATRESLTILEELSDPASSPEEREALIIAATEPNHLTQIDPFNITNFKIGFYDKTKYTFRDLPDFETTTEQEKLELEQAALEKVLEYYGKQLDAEHPGLIRFVGFRTPSLRPGDVYRAYFHVDKTILDNLPALTQRPTEQLQDISEVLLGNATALEEINKIVEEEFCLNNASLTDEERTIQYEKYKSFASKKKLELSRQISQKIIKARTENQDIDGLELDLGIFGTAQLSRSEINDLIALGPSTFLDRYSQTFQDVSDESPQTLGVDKRVIRMTFSELQEMTSKVAEAFEILAPDLNNFDVTLGKELPFKSSQAKKYAQLIAGFPEDLNVMIAEFNSRNPDYPLTLEQDTIVEIGFKNSSAPQPGSEIEFIQINKRNDSERNHHRFKRALTTLNARSRVGQIPHYIRNIEDLYKDAGIVDSLFDFSCETPPQDVSRGAGKEYILRYHVTYMDGVELKKSNPVHEWGKSISDAIVDTLGEKAPREDLFSFGYKNALPAIGEKCLKKDKDGKKLNASKPLKDLVAKTFSSKRLICEFVECMRLPNVQVQIPKIPKLRWPKIPTLSDNYWEEFKEISEEILLRMMCAFVKGILDILRSPMCEDRFLEGIFGAAASELPAVQRGLASGFLSTGISNDKRDDLNSLLEALMNLLSPTELCALLNGEPAGLEVYEVIRSLASTYGLTEELASTDQIIDLFLTIGFFVGPELCEEITKITIDVPPCTDVYSLMNQIRQAALKGESVSLDQIEKATEQAERELREKAAGLNFLMGDGSLGELLPNFTSSENNPLFSSPDRITMSAAEAAAKASFNMAEMSFVNSINGYIRSFYLQSQGIASPGDESYNAEANMIIQRASCNLQRFAREDMNISDFSSTRTTDKLRRIILMLCDDYTKETKVAEVFDRETGAKSEVEYDSYNMNSLAEVQREGKPLLSGSLIQKENITVAVSSEDDAKFYSQKRELYSIWSRMFPINAGDLDGATRTITSLVDWIKPEFKGGGNLSPADISTLNVNYLNKINQIMSELQKDISDNTERAFVPKTDQIFLQNIKEFYDTDSTLSQQLGGQDDLLSVTIDPLLRTSLKHPVPALRDNIDVTIRETMGVGFNSAIAKTTFEIKDDFFLGTTPGNPYRAEYCEPVPEKFVREFTDLTYATVQPRPFAYGSVVTDILKKNFETYKNSNINFEGYLNNTAKGGEYRRDIANQSYKDAYEGLYEQIADSVRKSRIFTDTDYRDRIDLKLRGKYYFDPSTGCFHNPNSSPKFGVLNFEKLITNEFSEQYMREFANPENSPLTEDFETPGSFEKAMMNTSLLGFIRICLIETLLKGAITLSVWDIDFVKDSKVYRDYLVEFVRNQIYSQELFTNQERMLDETIQRLSATNNIKAGLRKIILTEADGVISNLSKRIFEHSTTYNYSEWFLDSLPFVSVANTRSSTDSSIWKVNVDFDYANALKYNNFMFLEEYIRVNGSIRTFSSSKREIAQAQLRKLSNSLGRIGSIFTPGNYNIIPHGLLNPTDISGYEIGKEESVSLRGAFEDNDNYDNTELMSVPEFSALIRSLVDNNRELSRYFHDLSGKIYNPGNLSHGMPKALEEKTPSRVIKRTRQRVVFDKANIFSLLLKKDPSQPNARGEIAVDKFITTEYNANPQKKDAYLFNVLTTGEYGDEIYTSFSDANVSSLIRKAYGQSEREEDRYYMVTDQINRSIGEKTYYENNDVLLPKSQPKIRDGETYLSSQEEIAVDPTDLSVKAKVNFKAGNFKSGADTHFIETPSPSPMVTKNQETGEAEIIFSTPQNKMSKDDYDLFVEQNPEFETEIWEETVIDLIDDAAPIFQFPGDSGWIPKDHLTETQKSEIGQALKKVVYWAGDANGTVIGALDGVVRKHYYFKESSDLVNNPKKIHYTNVFGWNDGPGNTHAYPIKPFGSMYGAGNSALEAFRRVWDENTRTYYRNDLKFERSPVYGDFRISYETEQLTPNEYKIPLRLLITQVKNKQGDILKVFVRYVLPDFLDFNNDALNGYRAEKLTKACIDTCSGWGNLIVESFREIMSYYRASGDGRFEEYRHLLADPDNIENSGVYYNSQVLGVLKQGRGSSAHPLPPFTKGLFYGDDVENDDSWWGSRFCAWVSPSKLYSHACQNEAKDGVRNFRTDRAFLDTLFSNPGNLVRKPGNPTPATDPLSEYRSFKRKLLQETDVYSGSEHERHTSPDVLNDAHASNLDDHIREMFVHYNLSKHTLYQSSMHDTLSVYTNIVTEDRTRVNNPGISLLQTVGNLVSWFAQKRVDSFWGMTSRKENIQRLVNYGDQQTRSEWLQTWTDPESFWEKSEVENTRCGPSLFYNDMRTPTHILMYNMLREKTIQTTDFILNFEKAARSVQNFPGNSKINSSDSRWNWLLKEVNQINAYTHFKDSHYDENISQLISGLYSVQAGGALEERHPNANFFIQTNNRDQNPASTGHYFYWSLTEEEAKSMNMYMHNTEVPSRMHKYLTTAAAFQTIQSALNEELSPYRRHIINNALYLPSLLSEILARYDAGLDRIGVNQIAREVTTGYTEFLQNQDSEIISDILSESRISYGMRINMHNTMNPGKRNSDGTEFVGSAVNETIKYLWSEVSDVSEEERTGRLFIEGPSGEEREFYSIPIASTETLISDINCFQATNLITLQNKIREIKPGMIIDLKNTEEFQDFFNFAIPHKNVATSLTIHGTTMLAGYGDMPNFMDSTKAGIAAAFNASSVVDPYGQNVFGQYPSAAEIAMAFGSTGPAGGEDPGCFDVPDLGQWAKMISEMVIQFIKYFPSIILRGLADGIDPMYKEMRRHYLACELPDLRNASWASSAGSGKTPLGLRGSEQGDKRYVPLVPGVVVDMYKGGVQLATEFDATYLLQSIDKMIGYIYGGPLPLIDGIAAFRIPCAKINAEALQSWQKYNLGINGRYGHPITPLNLLALQTYELPRDLDLRRSICQNRDFPDPIICEDEE